jgi:hypothetical protein
MQKSKPLTDIEGEVREHAAADMKRFQRTKQALQDLALRMRGVRSQADLLASLIVHTI